MLQRLVLLTIRISVCQDYIDSCYFSVSLCKEHSYVCYIQPVVSVAKEFFFCFFFVMCYHSWSIYLTLKYNLTTFSGVTYNSDNSVIIFQLYSHECSQSCAVTSWLSESQTCELTPITRNVINLQVPSVKLQNNYCPLYLSIGSYLRTLILLFYFSVLKLNYGSGKSVSAAMA